MLSKDWAELVSRIVTELPVQDDGSVMKDELLLHLERYIRKADPTVMYERAGCILSDDYCKSIHSGNLLKLPDETINVDPVYDPEQLSALSALSGTDYASAILDLVLYPPAEEGVVVEVDPDALAMEEAVFANPYDIQVDPDIIALEEQIMTDTEFDMTKSESVPEFDRDLHKQLAEAKASADANMRAFMAKWFTNNKDIQ